MTDKLPQEQENNIEQCPPDFDGDVPMICGCCLWSEEVPLGFLCRCNPPSAGVQTASGILAAAQWPLVQEDDWCGNGFVPYNYQGE